MCLAAQHFHFAFCILSLIVHRCGRQVGKILKNDSMFLINFILFTSLPNYNFKLLWKLLRVTTQKRFILERLHSHLSFFSFFLNIIYLKSQTFISFYISDLILQTIVNGDYLKHITRIKLNHFESSNQLTIVIYVNHIVCDIEDPLTFFGNTPYFWSLTILPYIYNPFI